MFYLSLNVFLFAIVFPVGSVLQYASLLKQGKDKERSSGMQRRDSEDSVGESEISTFQTLKKNLADTIPDDQKHLLDGLLYYKVRFCTVRLSYCCVYILINDNSYH